MSHENFVALPRVVVITFLWAAIIYLGDLKTARCDNVDIIANSVTIPVTPAQDYKTPLASVRLNDKADGFFLIDTATNYSLISESVVKKLGIKTFPLMNRGKSVTLDGHPVQGVTVDIAIQANDWLSHPKCVI